MARPLHGHSDRTIDTPSPPNGIIVLCLIGIISTPFGLLPTFELISVGGEAAIFGYVLLALLVVSLVLYYGLLTLKSWAWPWAILYYGIGCLVTLVTLNIIGFIIQAIIVVYLFQVEAYYQ